MKRSLSIIPFMAVLLVLTGCAKEPITEVNSPTDINEDQPVKTVTPDEETAPADEEIDVTEDGNDNADTNEPEDGIDLPDLKVDMPNLKIVVPSDDEEDDTLSVVTPQFDLKVIPPEKESIIPQIPDPNPGF